MSSRPPERLPSFTWVCIVSFLISYAPYSGTLFPFKLGSLIPPAHAAESSDVTRGADAASPSQVQGEGKTGDDSRRGEDHPQRAREAQSPRHLSMESGRASGENSLGVSAILPEASLSAGAATLSIPISVPPGRGGISPHLALTYNSYQGNGWVGIGWNLDLGTIQGSTKKGLNYAPWDFVAAVNGSSSELIPRGDWGEHYFGAKIDAALSNGLLERLAIEMPSYR